MARTKIAKIYHKKEMGIKAYDKYTIEKIQKENVICEAKIMINKKEEKRRQNVES